MADYVELWGEFVKGKKSRRGQPLPVEPEPVVTLVAPSKIDAFLGSRTRAERVAHLRRLRAEGILVHSPKRLQQVVRDQGVRRAYVFRARADEVPRIERQAAAPPVTKRRARRPGRVGEITTV